MAHIHTKHGEHDHVVTMYIIRTDMDEPRALLHRHRKLGKYLPIGGHVELSESPWQAASHELREESGYRLEDMTILQPAVRIDALTNVVVHPVPIVMNTHTYGDNDAHFHSDTAYALVAKGDPNMDVGEGETIELEWVSAAELSALTEEDIYANTKEIYQFVFEKVFPNWIEVSTTAYSTRNPLP